MGRERVLAIVISAGLLERAIAQLHPYAAHLVAIPADADKGHDPFVRGEQNLRTGRRFVADRCGFLRGGEKTLCVNGEHRDDLPRSPPGRRRRLLLQMNLRDAQLRETSNAGEDWMRI